MEIQQHFSMRKIVRLAWYQFVIDKRLIEEIFKIDWKNILYSLQPLQISNKLGFTQTRTITNSHYNKLGVPLFLLKKIAEVHQIYLWYPYVSAIRHYWTSQKLPNTIKFWRYNSKVIDVHVWRKNFNWDIFSK